MMLGKLIGRCYLCGGPIRETHPTHVDHIVPISRGGGGEPENLARVHAKCNVMKSNKLVSELNWLGYREHEWEPYRNWASAYGR